MLQHKTGPNGRNKGVANVGDEESQDNSKGGLLKGDIPSFYIKKNTNEDGKEVKRTVSPLQHFRQPRDGDFLKKYRRVRSEEKIIDINEPLIDILLTKGIDDELQLFELEGHKGNQIPVLGKEKNRVVLSGDK